MIRIVFFVLIGVVFGECTVTNAILRLDTGGHTAVVRDIIITKSGDIISASDDKTIRIWDSKTRTEKRKILGQISNVSGEVYSIHLSKDEKLLYVKTVDDSRIYDYVTGKLLWRDEGVLNTVNFDYAKFTLDGKFMFDYIRTKIWDVENDFSPYDILLPKDTFLQGMISVENDYIIVLGDKNRKFLSTYSLRSKKLIKRINFSKKSSVSSNNKHIRVQRKGFHDIYDAHLEKIYTVKDVFPAFHQYTKNGAFLVSHNPYFGFDGNNRPRSIDIYDTENKYKKIASLPRVNGTFFYAVNMLDSKTAIHSEQDGSIHIWDIRSLKTEKLEGVGSGIYKIQIENNNITWRDKEKEVRTINLKNMQIKNRKLKNFKMLPLVKGDFSLVAEGWKLKLKEKGKSKTYSYSINDFSAYGFYKNYIIIGHRLGFLEVFDLKGKKVANLLGHVGIITSIGLDGDRLVSGSDDQTIRIWDLSQLGKTYDMQVFKKQQEILNSQFHTHINSKGRKLITFSLEAVKREILSNGLSIIPQLNLFITKTNFITKKEDWIAWTPEGFYNASKGAEKYIGYHINQGVNKEAKFLDISRFKKQFYRPDLIQKAIAGEDLSSYAKGIDIDSLLKAGLPPKVKILNSAGDIADNELKIVVDVCDQGGGHENLQFYVDKTPIKYLKQTKNFGAGANGNCTVFTQVLLLPSGEHKIGVDATNKEGNIISNTSSILINNTKVVARKPNLHILTISVADYKDDSLDLRYPNNDASKMIAKLKAIKGSVFGKVFEHSLVDSEVDYESIKKKADEISANVDVEDVFVLFVSGHGVSKDGNYYFIPYACTREANVKEEAISHEQLTNVITRVGTNKIVILLDTCDSGSMATAVKRFGSDIHSAIISGTTSKQSALDGYKEHGMFTYTLLDAMNKTEYYGADKKLSVSEIAEHAKYLLPKIAKKSNHVQEVEFFMNGDTLFHLGDSE